jgi:hypothetical protein
MITWQEVALAAMFLICLTSLFAWVTACNVFKSIAKHGIEQAAKHGDDFTMDNKK